MSNTLLALTSNAQHVSELMHCKSRDARPSGTGTTRREVLTAFCAGGLALGLSSRSAKAALLSRSSAFAFGRVIEDGTGLGTGTRHDRGIGGVMVSNGRDVTRTAQDGSWSLPMRDGDGVFVVKPSHWRTSRRSSTPAPFWIYRGHTCEPVAGRIDFALERAEEADQFDVLLFADTQPSNCEELKYVRQDLINAARNTAAAFAIHHGDVMGDDLGLLPDYLEVIKETGLPWHHCPGNHDMNTHALSASSAFETWKRLVGPTHYAFEHGNAVFIILNNVEYLAPSDRIRAHKPYQGRIGAEQLQFVRNVLANVPEDRLAVVSMHVPLQSFNEPDGATTATADRSALLQLLSQRQHTISFSGHSHTTEHHYLGCSDGFEQDRPHHHHVLTAVCGSWWSGERDESGVPVADSRDGSPRGHHILSIAGNKASTRFVPAATAASQQMRVMLCRTSSSGDRPDVLANTPIKRCDLAAMVLVADVFDGGPRTRVSFEMADRALAPMQAIKSVDPYVAESYARAPHLCKPWVVACASSHMWQAQIPMDLAPGSHRIAVIATTEYGVTHRDEIALEVEG
jgi:hypothetical protein